MQRSARIKLTAGGMTQTEQIRSGRSYLSQRIFVRTLALAPRPESTASKFAGNPVPTDIVKNLEVDKFYSALEGQGIVPAEQVQSSAVARRSQSR
ncbi:MAG TPA: hypothetical protein VFF64_23550 [Candidatus Eremiobacteraceae bacterium]|nr:hypothetical protein [Candidatus Eremiobacteraceae bacterium]